MNIIPASVVEQIKLDEGLSLKPYQCTADKFTIGYGRNIEDNGISEEEAEFLLLNDIKNTQKELLANFEWFVMLNAPKQGVLINMCFNLGLTRFKQFKKMITAIEMGDYDEAAEQMLDSKWARQVGNRAIRLSNAMRKGQCMELWYREIDTVLIGIENADTHVKAWHLCPYSTLKLKEAMSFKSTIQRIEIIDNILAKCAAL